MQALFTIPSAGWNGPYAPGSGSGHRRPGAGEGPFPSRAGLSLERHELTFCRRGRSATPRTSATIRQRQGGRHRRLRHEAAGVMRPDGPFRPSTRTLLDQLLPAYRGGIRQGDQLDPSRWMAANRPGARTIEGCTSTAFHRCRRGAEDTAHVQQYQPGRPTAHSGGWASRSKLSRAAIWSALVRRSGAHCLRISFASAGRCDPV